MTDPESGAPASRPPARPPGDLPPGYVPRDSVPPASPPPPPTAAAVVAPQPLPAYGSPGAPPLQPRDSIVSPDATGGREGEVPFLDTPGVPPQTKRQAGYWLLFAVAGFLIGQIGAEIFAVIAGAIAGKSAAQMSAIASANVPPEWYVVSTLLGLWVGFIGAPWLASRTQGTRNFVRDLGIRFKTIDLVGIAIGVVGQFADRPEGYNAYQHLFHHNFNNFNGASSQSSRERKMHGAGFVVIAVATVLLAPAAEELFFRGLLLKSLVRLFTPLRAIGGARTIGVVLAVVADGLLFGAAHGEWVQFAGLAFFGIVLSAVSYRTGRLGMNYVSHATFNLVAIVAIATNGSVVFH